MLPAMTDLALSQAIEKIKLICDNSGGRSQFFPPGGSGYKASIAHYFESSTEPAGAAVQPGSVEDLQLIVKVIAETRVHFAVKCGGHSTNPGFSSTDGIQIHLIRFNRIDIDVENKRVRVGAGCLFEELYGALYPYGLNIVGGSAISGPGVAGWILGGGYSVKTSQYGLGVDNLAGVKLVLPNGEFTEASETTNSELFFAIKGGGNNFGIITEMTLIAHEQGEFHDFTLIYSDRFDEVKAAVVKIVAKQDHKANIGAAFRYHAKQGCDRIKVMMTVHCVYDGAYPTGEDPFAELNDSALGENIRKFHAPTAADVTSRGHMTSPCLLTDLRLNGTYDVWSELHKDHFPRGRWGNVMVDEFTPGIIDEIERQSREAAREMTRRGGIRVTIGLWPFTRAMFNKTTRSAWPHVKGQPNCPIVVYLTWEGEENDGYWFDVMRRTLNVLRAKVFEERPSARGLPYLVNTALAETTTVEDLYRDNLGELKRLRKRYDEHNVMSLAGGFRIPLE